MTPEERARSLYTKDPDIGLTPQAETGIRVIASAIREAENAALERAAEGTGRYLMVRTGLKVEKVVEVEAAIRSLKTKSA